MANEIKMETRLAQAGSRGDPRTGALTMPIYQTASFAHPELGQSTGFDYSRTANPTRLALENTLASIEGGDRAFAFGSGLAAIDAVLRLFAPGDKIVVTEDLYGGTFRLFAQVARPIGIEPVFVDTSDTDLVARTLSDPSVKGLFVESPTNPLLKVADLGALAELCRARGVRFIVDNTFLTPYLQQPLAWGADLTVYSATKYLAGHNDVVAGAVVTSTSELSGLIGFYQNAVGAILGPMDAWLTLRGLKTLPLRLRYQQESARRIAAWLSEHPRIARVYYPGFGGMVSFEVRDPERIKAILKGVNVFLFAESLGGVESLITYPLVQTHADMDPELLVRLGIGNRLLRLSIGIEHPDDLIGDLEALL